MLGDFFLTMPNYWYSQVLISSQLMGRKLSTHAQTLWLTHVPLVVTEQAPWCSPSISPPVSSPAVVWSLGARHIVVKGYITTHNSGRDDVIAQAALYLYVQVTCTTVQLCSENIYVYTGVMNPCKIIAVLQCGTKVWDNVNWHGHFHSGHAPLFGPKSYISIQFS